MGVMDPLKGVPANSARLPEQQADIAVGSPLAVIALFTEIIRQRFRVGNELAWYWEDNPTPQSDEDNMVDKPRQLMIEPAFTDNPEARNFRPAIYIDKGDTQGSKIAINNMAGRQLKTGLTGFYMLALIPIDIEIMSGAKGESATLADIVWFYLLAGREQIRATFGIHDIGMPVLGRTTPETADNTQWSTHVTFSIEVEFRWLTRPISPMLREIVLKFQASGETNPDAFLLQQYIR